jgi:hypothetical protein
VLVLFILPRERGWIGSVVEKHVRNISGTDAMVVRMKEKQVVADLVIGSPSTDRRLAPEH